MWTPDFWSETCWKGGKGTKWFGSLWRHSVLPVVWAIHLLKTLGQGHQMSPCIRLCQHHLVTVVHHVLDKDFSAWSLHRLLQTLWFSKTRLVVPLQWQQSYGGILWQTFLQVAGGKRSHWFDRRRLTPAGLKEAEVGSARVHRPWHVHLALCPWRFFEKPTACSRFLENCPWLAGVGIWVISIDLCAFKFQVIFLYGIRSIRGMNIGINRIIALHICKPLLPYKSTKCIAKFRIVPRIRPG